MGKKLQFKRLLVLTLLMAAAFAGLGYRLIDLQVLRHATLAKEASGNTHFTMRLEPRRGDILDIKGNLLATSVFVKTVCADPTVLSNHMGEVAQLLAPYLQMSEGELQKKLTPRKQQNKKGEWIDVQYEVLKRKVSSDTWDKIAQAMAQYPFGGVAPDQEKKQLNKKQQAYYNLLRQKAVFTDPMDDQLRTYPNGALAAHVLGFVGFADQTNNDGTHVTATVGEDGIEQKFDAKLRGVRGWRVSEHDRQQREMVALRQEDVQPCDGLDVVLTIDSEIQHITETAIAEGMQKNSPLSVSGIVIRPRTGEILAMASLPNFDPNNPGGVRPEDRRDRMVTDAAEPGSTFKIVVVSGALNDHLVKLTDTFDCMNGVFYYAGKTLHDHKRYGILSVNDIIAKSSNIGAAKVGLLMGEAKLYDYIRAFGFGSTTGVPLPNESRGVVYPINKWNKLSITRIPMGHEVQATSMQMVMAMSAVANKGVLMQPMLVDHLVDSDGSIAVKYYPQQVRRVMSESADRDMIEALKSVVTSDGTAVHAALTNYTVAGKTGTAQESDGHSYEPGKYFSSFIGFFPADNPEICIYVAMSAPKDGHYGGDVAAPLFHEIAERCANYLNIRPDRNNTNGLPVGPQNFGTEQPFKTAEARLP